LIGATFENRKSRNSLLVIESLKLVITCSG
jgi:hypothetical protein